MSEEAIVNKIIISGENSHSYVFDETINVVYIKNDVKTLKPEMFKNFLNLTKVIFEENSILESIEESCFEGCKILNTFEFPLSLKKIGENAFRSCHELKSVVDLSNLEYLGENAFVGCREIRTVKLPTNKNFRIINNNTFKNCSKIVELIIPNNIEILSKSSFSNLENLNKVVFSESSNIKIIGENCFSSNVNLKEIFIPKSLEEIGKYAFSNNSTLSKLTFESDSKLKKIGEKAFYNTKKLKSVIIPESIKLIEKLAFYSYINFKMYINLPEIPTHWPNDFATFNSSIYVMNSNNSYQLVIIPIPAREVTHSFALCEFVNDIISLNYITNNNIVYDNRDNLKKINNHDILKKINHLKSEMSYFEEVNTKTFFFYYNFRSLEDNFYVVILTPKEQSYIRKIVESYVSMIKKMPNENSKFLRIKLKKFQLLSIINQNKLTYFITKKGIYNEAYDRMEKPTQHNNIIVSPISYDVEKQIRSDINLFISKYGIYL